ncbi:MAG: CAP domain-containing protein [Nitrosopumilaceae archaeon]
MIPIFLLGAAFSLGIIEFSPQGGTIFVHTLENAKDEILDLAQGKTTIDESFDKVNTSVEEATEESSKKLDNVIKYTQKKANPSQSIADENKPEFDPVQIEYLIHEYTNKERVNHGLSQLAFDPEIAQIARGHSSDMANREYFAHETPEGLSPTERADQNGYSCQKIVGFMIYSGIAENIFQGHLFESYYTINGEITSYEWNTEEDIAKITVEGWMDSPGHRENILTEVFDREGIGVEITQDHKVYVTQNFC